MTMRAKVDAFIGYLVCGFLLLAACEAAAEGNWLVEREWKLGAQVFFGTVALCSGWAVSRVGLALLEHKFVRGCLGVPEETLFADPAHVVRGWKHILFRGYYRPISGEARERIQEAATRDGFAAPDRALYLYALAIVEQEPALWRKVERCRNLCGICRGLCVGFVVVSMILVMGIIWHGLYYRLGQADLRKLGYCLLSLWEALLMVYRFLKLRRQFAIDVLTNYSAVYG